jgi:hypothetical protein
VGGNNGWIAVKTLIFSVAVSITFPKKEGGERAQRDKM